jgi:hypothetical protein
MVLFRATKLRYRQTSNVISTSYGYNEADLTRPYTARQCAECAKLGLMGVTVLYSSGDNGVAGSNNACLNPSGSQSARGKRFNPGFPVPTSRLLALLKVRNALQGTITVDLQQCSIQSVPGTPCFSQRACANRSYLLEEDSRTISRFHSIRMLSANT